MLLFMQMQHFLCGLVPAQEILAFCDVNQSASSQPKADDSALYLQTVFRHGMIHFQARAIAEEN
jgi:hypothetical protein